MQYSAFMSSTRIRLHIAVVLLGVALASPNIQVHGGNIWRRNRLIRWERSGERARFVEPAVSGGFFYKNEERYKIEAIAGV